MLERSVSCAAFAMFVCVSAWVWCGICGVTLYHSLCAWPVLCPRVNQSWCRHLRRLRGKLIFKNCALKCHINYVTYLRAKPPPPEVGSAYRVCDRWEREREMRREGERSACPARVKLQAKKRTSWKMEILQSNNFTIARELQKPQRHPRWKMLFQRKTPHTQRVAGGGWQQMEWREKKSKLRDTFAQLVNDLDSCGEHVCECWSIGVCVCVCAHHVRRLTIDWVVVVVVVVAWRRRKLRVVNSWPHTENVRANQCVCACVLPFVLYEFS